MITTLLQPATVWNLIGHLTAAWDQGQPPTGSTLEHAIYEGLRPDYPTTRHGGALTFVDVVTQIPDVGRLALDVKGRKTLTMRRRRKQWTGTWYPADRRVEVIARRPTRDMQHFQGDAQTLVQQQVDDYAHFAQTSAHALHCDTIATLICLYGEAGPYRRLELYLEPFVVEPVVTAHTSQSAAGIRTYVGCNATGDDCYAIVPFSAGSQNFYRTLTLATTPIHYAYVATPTTHYYTREELESKYGTADTLF